jgi:hypothetical protein
MCCVARVGSRDTAVVTLLNPNVHSNPSRRRHHQSASRCENKTLQELDCQRLIGIFDEVDTQQQQSRRLTSQIPTPFWFETPRILVGAARGGWFE